MRSFRLFQFPTFFIAAWALYNGALSGLLTHGRH